VIVDRRTGANVWLTVGLKEGKNREVRKVLAHVGLSVNRLMRIAYGPFQLGALKKGEAEEVRPAVLREQLGRLYPLDASNHPASEVAPAPSGRAKAKPKPTRSGGKGAGWAKASKKDEPGHKARKRAEKAEAARKGELTSAKGPRRPSSKAGAKPGPKGGGARDAHRRGRS
jgi:23S rRNA pseudouridine2605 synthase